MKRLCVFAGLSSGRQPECQRIAKDLGRALADRQIGLVYGGAKVGLMGVVANAALTAAGLLFYRPIVRMPQPQKEGCP